MTRALLSRPVGLLFLLPALLFVAVFMIYPFFSIVAMSFTNYQLVGASALNTSNVGLDNYSALFNFDRWMRRGELGHSLLLTAQFVIGSALIGQVFVGMGLAVLFNRRKGILREIVYTLAIAAWIMPEVVVAFAWFAYLAPEGTLNVALETVGLQTQDWLFNYPMFSIILYNTWRGSAFSMLLFSSALSSIPPSQLETADVIGASGWQKFRDILLPQLGRYILTDVLLITLWTFNSFGPYLITRGGPTFRTDLVSVYLYRIGLQNDFQLGKASAIAVVIMSINLMIAGLYLLAARARRRA
jgi:multiple sugar transport system permease protein